MVAALGDALLGADKLPAVQSDVLALIDARCRTRRARRASLSRRIRRGEEGRAVDRAGCRRRLLPDFVARLQPFWADFAGNGSFADYLTARGEQVADALLGVTDDKIAGTDKAAVKKVYDSLRPSAKKHVVEALPRLGALIQKHAG